MQMVCHVLVKDNQVITQTTAGKDDVAAIDELGEVSRKLKEQLARVIVGQNEVIERLMICLFAKGHALLMGVRDWPRRY